MVDFLSVSSVVTFPTFGFLGAQKGTFRWAGREEGSGVWKGNNAGGGGWLEPPSLMRYHLPFTYITLFAPPQNPSKAWISVSTSQIKNLSLYTLTNLPEAAQIPAAGSDPHVSDSRMQPLFPLPTSPLCARAWVEAAGGCSQHG